MTTIQVRLKPHIVHKTDYMFERIKPAVVCEALKYLIKTTLYLKQRVQISEEYLSMYEGDFEEEVDLITEKNDGVENEPAGNNKIVMLIFSMIQKSMTMRMSRF